MSMLLDIRDVSLKIPGVEKPVLSHISYQIQQGDIVILLGSNGSGKSSLLKCIDGRYHPTSGNIFMQEKLILNPYKQGIATITQQSSESLFPSLTLLEHFLLIKKGNESLAYFINHLSFFNENLPKKLHQVVDQLSGGEKQAFILALTFLHPPQLLLLDEHTSALDPTASERLMKITYTMIHKHHITCLMTTHDLAIAERYGNRVLALKQGKIIKTIHNKEKFDAHALLTTCY